MYSGGIYIPTIQDFVPERWQQYLLPSAFNLHNNTGDTRFRELWHFFENDPTMALDKMGSWLTGFYCKGVITFLCEGLHHSFCKLFLLLIKYYLFTSANSVHSPVRNMHQDMRGAFLLDSKCTPIKRNQKSKKLWSLIRQGVCFHYIPKRISDQRASVEATSYGVNFRTQLIKPELLNSFWTIWSQSIL